MQSSHPEEGTSITRLEFFFRKFLRLTAGKLDRLGADLGLSEKAIQACWNLFVHTLEAESDLLVFYQRHYLQILISTVYSVAKLFDENQPFTRIIGSLQSQLGHSLFPDSLFRIVYMGPDQPAADLVKFYNDVYLGKVRDIIYKLPRHPIPTSHLPQTPTKSGSDSEGLFLPMPTSLSPMGPSLPRFISDRITLELSPLKERLSRTVSQTKTPTKLNITSTFAQATMETCESSLLNTSRLNTPVARRLDF